MIKQRNIRTVLFIACLLLYFVDSTQANKSIWPQFRGQNFSGQATEGQNSPVEFSPEHNVVWKIPLPSGHSSPCIWGDNIFLTGFYKEKKELQVLCIERISGNIRWRRIIPTQQIEKVHPISSPATATPATDGERVYLYFGSYGILCYDFEGKLLWTVPLPMPKVRFGSGTSPIISGELVILNRDEQNDPHLLAVDCRSGKTVWRQSQQPASTLGVASYSTPVQWADQVVIHRMGEIAAYSVRDGTRMWSIRVATNGESTPVVGDDVLFVGTWSNFGEPELRVELPNFQALVKQYDANGDRQISRNEFPSDLVLARRPEVGHLPGGTLYVKPFFQMIDSDQNKCVDEKEWKEAEAFVLGLSEEHGLVAIRTGGEGDITNTNILWQEKRHVPEVPSPLYLDGRVYIVKNGGLASCIKANNGELLYRERLGAAGPYYSSPITADGKIYIASEKGIITVFTAGDQLNVLARNNLKESIFATPAIVDNKLYVRTIKHMYAFGEQ